MEERQKNLLKYIIEEHIQTAAPVSSSLMAEKYFPSLSSATIRNEMAELEDLGYIVQPHTSAGRIPTLLGFKHYVNSLENDDGLSAKDENNLDKIDLSGERGDIKVLAKKLAEMSNDAVVIGFSPFDVYYTGLSNLFSQPEFMDNDLVHSMSQVIDDLDRVMEQVYQTAGDNSEVVLGEDNPFGNSCSAVVSRMQFNGGEIVLAILGPMRMDYSRNLSLIEYLQKKANRLGEEEN
ncbi:MAG: hypothetical protein WCT26_00655 [Candidatus Buchananbacteria bacterium]|jgi:transcriptional regulator of heat shock response